MFWQSVDSTRRTTEQKKGIALKDKMKENPRSVLLISNIEAQGNKIETPNVATGSIYPLKTEFKKSKM